MRWALLGIVVGCTSTTIAVEGDACTLAAQDIACPECLDGTPTCTYEGVTVSEPSCGLCQVEHAMYAALCDRGVTNLEGEITCRCTRAAACD